jgi:hypothetical protein
MSVLLMESLRGCAPRQDPGHRQAEECRISPAGITDLMVGKDARRRKSQCFRSKEGVVGVFWMR